MMKSRANKPKKRSRRPKYLSLHHLHLSSSSSSATTTAAAAVHQTQLMDLFPTQPGTTSASTASPLDDKDHDNNVARFFAAADSCATTLTGLLTAPTSSPSAENNEAGSPASVSAYSDRDGFLARNALRSRERVEEEEEEEEEIRWVRLSEVVGERKAAEEEVSSRAVAEGEEVWWLARRREGGGGGLSLKLDYKEVSEAWCGVGRPFWRVSGAAVDQTVPNLQLVQDDARSLFQLNMAHGGLWRVPNQTSHVGYGKEEDGGEAIEVPKVGQREASVLRYKEKRMNRLFSKQIRYQVRKLNAEKRPRIKGRFVKRS